MDDLNKQVINLLEDTEYPYTKIYNFLKLHFEPECFKVKGRIKSPTSFVKKVIGKKKSSADYRLTDVEDILGFRLVVLTKSEIPETLERLLRELSNEDFISGTSFDVELSEVTYYRKRVPEKKFIEHINAVFNKSLYGKIDCFKVEEKDSGYSSLHVLFKCKSDRFELVDFIPIEIQIRTAFEEVWGEIEHKLKYKFPLEELGLNSYDQELLTVLHEGLTNLKSHVDTADATADALNYRVESLQDRVKRRPLSTDMISEYSPTAELKDWLSEMGFSDEYDRYINAVKQRDKAQNNYLKNSKLWSESTSEIEASIAVLNGLHFRLRTESDNDEFSEQLKGALRTVRFEIAYNKLKLGEILNQFGDKDLAEDHLRSSASIYEEYFQKMVASEVEINAIVPYRLAQVRYQQEEFNNSQEFLVTAREWLSADEKYSKLDEHWLHTVSLRFHALVLWTIGMMESRIKEIKKDHIVDVELQLQLFSRAFKMTLESSNKKVIFYNSSGKKVDETGKYKARSVNNLICYAIDILNLKGGKKALVNLIPGRSVSEFLQDSLRQIGADKLKKLEQINSIDSSETICRAYFEICKTEKNAVTKKSLSLLRISANRTLALLVQKYLDVNGSGIIEDLERPSIMRQLGKVKLHGLDGDTLKNLQKCFAYLEKKID